MVFNNRTPSLSQTIFNLSSSWENYVVAKSRESGLVPPPLPSRERVISWFPPPCPLVKVSVDASWRQGANSARVGLVV